MSVAIEEIQITKRAAAIYFWLGVPVLVLPFCGETTLLFFFVSGLFFVAFAAWVACAAYASYLSWRHTTRIPLRVLSVLSLLLLLLVSPWGPSVSGEVATSLFQGLIAVGLVMVVLAFFVYQKAKKMAPAKPVSQSPHD